MPAPKKTALIIGVAGQDGRILFDLLAASGYGLIGVDKKSIRTWKIKWNSRVDINKKKDVFKLIKTVKPDEVYYLAAFHQAAQDKKIAADEDLRRSYEINVFAFFNFLEGVRLFSPSTKIFYASSSLIFGNCRTSRQSEETPYRPESAYGLTKMLGLELGRLYRERYKIFVSSGILYNHESQYRTENFISAKIIRGALRIKAGKQKELVIGDLGAKVDWGYAPDYVLAMKMILGLRRADDFIVATGRAHTVLDFIKISFGYLDLDWRKFVREDKSIIKRKSTILIGDAGKLRNKTKWRPSVAFSAMIKKIIDNLE